MFSSNPSSISGREGRARKGGVHSKTGIALVTQASLATQQVQISFYSTSTGQALAGSGQVVQSLSITLKTTASGQEVVYGNQTTLLSSVTCP
jgi:protein-disulfide isomerase